MCVCQLISGDMHDKVSPEFSEKLKKLRPPKDASIHDNLKAFSKMDELLEQNLAKAFPVDLQSPCLKHGRLCPTWQDPPRDLCPSSSDPVTLTGAGPMCTPFCPSGKQQKLADPATEAWHIYSHHQQARQPDVAFTENSSLFPTVIWQRRMSDTHDLICIVFCSQETGWPSCRKRWLCWSVKRSTFVWVGIQN